MPTNGSPIYTPPPSTGGGGASPNPATSVTSSAVGDAGTVGTSLNYAREDHDHPREGFGSPATLNTDGSAADGTAVSVARSDHKHGIPSALNANARVAVSRAGALVGTRRGINLINGSNGVSWTVNDNSGSERVDITPYFTATDSAGVRTASLTTLTHSWGSGTYYMNGYAGYAQNGFTARLCGLLGVTNDNLQNYGTAGSSLSMPVNISYTTVPMNGWAAIYQMVVPNNSTLYGGTGTVRCDANYPNPNPFVILHGINDVYGVTAQQAANSRNAYKNALRAVVSRMRAGSLWCSYMTNAGTLTWDSAITSTGFTNVAQSLTNTGAGVKTSSTNGDTVTFTIPTGYTGGTLAFSFIGQANAYDTLSTSATAGATSIALTGAAASEFVNTKVSYPCTVNVGTGTGVATAYSAGTMTIAAPGITAAANAGDGVSIKQSLGVTWSTNRAGDTIVSTTPTTILGGQGQQGQECAVVTRFKNLNYTYAGKTITATVTGVTAGDTSKVKFDSVWLEADTNAPPVLVGNIPIMGYIWYPPDTALAPNIFNYNVRIPTYRNLNTDITSVVGEFDANVVVVDINTAMTAGDGKFAADVVSAGAPGDSIALSVTANSTNFNWNVGDVIASKSEQFLITAISGSYPSYTVTCTRSPSGVIGTSNNTTHTTGEPIHLMVNMATDHLHESALGASKLARAFAKALDAMPAATDTQSGLVTASYTQEQFSNSIGVGDTDWLQPQMGGTTTVALTQNKSMAIPVYIPRDSVIVGAGVVCGAASTGTIRLGLWECNMFHSLPYRLVADMGTISPVTANTFYQTSANAVYVRVKPGWYWVGCMLTTAAGVTLRAIGGANNAPGYQLPLTVNPSATTSHYTGYQGPTVGVSGSFDTNFYAVGTNPTPVTASPIVWINVRTTGY